MNLELCIIINASSGDEKETELISSIEELLRSKGITGAVELARSGEDIMRLANEAFDSGVRTIVAGGGDGTVNAIASIVVGTDRNLGVLPLGTLNHFAKDLGIPLDLEEAIDVLAAGHLSTLDSGEVNGKTFINNSSLGLYPSIVKHREEQQQRLGRSKWMALAWATLTMLGRYPFITVRLTADGKEVLRRTPLLFVGNNEYRIEGFDIGTRKRIDAGWLCLYMPHKVGKLRLLWMAVQALFGTLREAEEFDATCVKELEIETGRGRLQVAVDGEVMTMQTPLRYRILPRSLRVVTPLGAEEEHRAAENEIMEKG